MKQTVWIREGFVLQTFPSAAGRQIDRISQMTMDAVEALFLKTNRLGFHGPIYFGSAFGPLESLFSFNCVCEREGALRVSPSLFPSTVLNAPACQASIRHHLTGPIMNLSTGNCSGVDALGLAALHLEQGGEREALVVLAEEASPVAAQMTGQMPREGAGAFLLSIEEGSIQVSGYEKSKQQGPPCGGVADLLEGLSNWKKEGGQQRECSAQQGAYRCLVRLTRRNKNGFTKGNSGAGCPDHSDSGRGDHTRGVFL